MKLKKGRKIAAILLAAAIVSADFHGAGSLAYASQQESQREEAEYARTAEGIERTRGEEAGEPEGTEAQGEEAGTAEGAEKTQGEEAGTAGNTEIPREEAQGEEAGTAEGTEPQDERNGSLENIKEEKEDTQEKAPPEGTEPLFLQEADEKGAGVTEGLTEAQAFDFSQAEAAFAGLLKEYDMYGVLANDVEFPIYQEPSQEAVAINSLTSGSQVKLEGVVWNETGLWFQIGFASNDIAYSGYIQSEYVVTADSRLEEWKAQYLPDYAVGTLSRGAARGATQVSAFPSSYQPFIQKLIQAHPNWTFVPMNTGLEWADVLAAEMKNGVNLVETYQPDTWKSTAPEDYNMETGEWVIKNGTNWVQASESIVKYFLDPRNFLQEEYVFQFEQLVYGDHHTEDGVEKILSGTFMSHKKLEDGSEGGITYAQAFMKIGKDLKVSPYFLASRVRQEQGVSGTSSLISGTYPGYEGYYNYFNRRATGIGEEVIRSGLQEAKDNGWDTRYKALEGGAKSVSSDYIFKGQDTLYLQKFDVDPSYNGLYWHQYMQNLLGPYSEGKSVRKGYEEMGILNNGFVFKVPVYNNMPGSPCPKPEEGLNAPTVTAQKNGYVSAKLSWNEVAAAQGYQIYRAEGEDGTFTRIKSTNAATRSFEDTTIVPGKLYRYKVRAYMKLSSGNKYSSYSSIKTLDFTVPATTWNTFKIKNYKTIELSWGKKSVDGYKIYRKTGTGKYTCIQTIKDKSTVSFKDTAVKPKNTYTYRIRGYVSVNGKNYYSKYTSVNTAELKMAKPQLKKAYVSGGKKIKVTWKRDSKADGYYIYRATSKKGTYKKVKTITKNKTVSWSDTSIKTGKTYYYKIRSFVKASTGTKSSSYSTVFSVKTALKTPAVTSVTASKGKVKLKWKKDSNAAGYKIYRATSKNGKYKVVKKLTKNSTLSWTDKTVKTGKKYYYKIRAYSINQGQEKHSSYSPRKGIKAK